MKASVVVAEPVPANTLEVVASATVAPSAPPLIDGKDPARRPTALADIVDLLKRELGVEADTLPDAVDKCCDQLGVSKKKGSLVDRANMCYDKIFVGKKADSSSSSSAAPAAATGQSQSKPSKSGSGMLNDPNFQKALIEMKRVAASQSNYGPRGDQLKAHGWFDSQWRHSYPLHRAAMHGDVEEIVNLIQGGRDPNEKMTPWFDSEALGWAASFNQVDAVVALVERGADPRRPANKAGFTPIGDAAREKATAVENVLTAFLDTIYGGVHAGEGSRSNEYEPNYAKIACPIAGHPEFDKGAYYEPIGCCFYVTEKNNKNADRCGPILCGHITLACWVATLCYQPCGIICAHQCPWLGDCPFSEQRVTHDFVQRYPGKVTRGPAKIRYEQGKPHKFA